MLSEDQIANSCGFDTIALASGLTVIKIEIYSSMDIEWHGLHILIFNWLRMMNDNVEMCGKFPQCANQRDKIIQTKHMYTLWNELYKWDVDKWMIVR